MRFWAVAGAAAADMVASAQLVIVPMSVKRVYLDRYAQPVADEGLGALYFGIVPEAVGPFKEAFGVPEEHEPIGAIAIGRNGEAAPRDLRARRRPARDIIHDGRW